MGRGNGDVGREGVDTPTAAQAAAPADDNTPSREEKQEQQCMDSMDKAQLKILLDAQERTEDARSRSTAPWPGLPVSATSSAEDCANTNKHLHRHGKARQEDPRHDWHRPDYHHPHHHDDEQKEEDSTKEKARPQEGQQSTDAGTTPFLAALAQSSKEQATKKDQEEAVQPTAATTPYLAALARQTASPPATSDDNLQKHNPQEKPSQPVEDATNKSSTSSDEKRGVGVGVPLSPQQQDSHEPGAHRMFPSDLTCSQTKRHSDADDKADIQIGDLRSSAKEEKQLSAFLAPETDDDANIEQTIRANANLLFGDLEEIGEGLMGEDSSHCTSEGGYASCRSLVSTRPSELLPSSSVQVVEGEATTKRKKRLTMAAILAMLLIIVGLVVGLTVSRDGPQEELDGTTLLVEDIDDLIGVVEGTSEVDATLPTISTMEQIRTDGFLKCGHRPPPPNIFQEEPGKESGFDAQLCYAIAAALQVPVKFVDASGSSPIDLLANGTIDVLTRARTHTMERNLLEGYAFSVPYLYGGLQAAGDPFYVTRCADQNFRYLEECAGLEVCVAAASTHEKILARFLTIRKIVPVDSLDALREGLAQGRCNVIVHEGPNLAERLVREAGYTGDFVLGNQLYSKEPLGIVTRSTDPVFSSFVSSVLQALMVAEERGITQSTAQQFPLMNEFWGDSSFQYAYPDAYRDAIQAGGNFGELYEKYLEPLFPRQAMNNIYSPISSHDNGLLYAHPFGKIGSDRGSHPLGSKLQSLLDQGYLRCGIQVGRPGMAWEEESLQGYVGMDVDYCRALSASLFSGNTESLQLVPIADLAEGSQLLVDGLLDVVAGAPWALSTTTQCALTQPYFYGSLLNNMTTACLMTSHDDHEWSSFVYWVVTSTVYAEDKEFSSETSNEMPEVAIMGPAFKRMLRDAIFAVGNSADIYERNMEEFLPRQPPNTLNGSPLWGPQHYPMTGFD